MNVPRLPPGTIVAGKYTVQSELGRSPTSATYAAIAAPGREVVLRMMAPDAIDEARASAVRALNVAAANVPEHLVAHVIEGGRDEATGAPFLVTPRSVHPSLAELVEVCPFEKEEALAVVAGLIRACGPLHAQGIAHLALHPRNVFIGPAPERVVQLGDLSAYRLRPAAPPWAAPEQLDARDVSIAADMFAIALLAFFALTGKPLVETREEIFSPPTATARASAIGVSLPSAVDAVFARALARAPSDRYASVDELHEALADAFGIAKPTPSIPPESAPRFFPASGPGQPAAQATGQSAGDIPVPPAAPPAPPYPFEQVAPVAPIATLAHEPLPPPFPVQADPDPHAAAIAPRKFLWLGLLAAVVSLGVLTATAILVLRMRERGTETPIAAPSASAIEPAADPAPKPKPEPEPSAAAEPPPVDEPEPSPLASASAAATEAPSEAAAHADAPALRLRPNEGELVIECEPKCGLIMLDGKRIKRSPVAVRAGKHGVGVSRPGYAGQWQLVKVDPGQRAEARFVLVPKR